MPRLEDIVIGGSLDPLMAALIITLYRNDALSGPDINRMARRLEAAGKHQDAMALRLLVVEAAMGEPD